MEVTTDTATLHNLGERCETQPSLAFLRERDDMEACLAVHTPELGIELVRTRHPELILPDINMPGMDGYQVLGAFKADASTNGIPVVAITANAMPSDIERGKAAGFADYLTRPIDVARYFNLLDHCLSGRGESQV